MPSLSLKSPLLSPHSCLFSHVFCLTSPVSSLSHTSPVSRQLAYIFCLLSPVLLLSLNSWVLSHVSCLLSHVSYLMPLISRLLSHVSYLTSLISRLLSHMPNILRISLKIEAFVVLKVFLIVQEVTFNLDFNV